MKSYLVIYTCNSVLADMYSVTYTHDGNWSCDVFWKPFIHTVDHDIMAYNHCGNYRCNN